MSEPRHISILGGGISGLSAGYYAKKYRVPFTVYEANSQVGGSCATVRHGDFLFDTGAHRFHDKNAQVTQEIIALLGNELQKNEVPSRIYLDHKLIDFPLSPLNLWKNLGTGMLGKAAIEVARERLLPQERNGSFESFALRAYGKTIAELLLLSYSEKLWGIPCTRLSADITGKRLKNLGVGTLLVEAILGTTAKTEHLEGSSFYYPRMGIGMIPQKLEEFCGAENVLKNSSITKIFRDDTKIQAIEVGGRQTISVAEVLSTLPVNLFLELMEPKLPPEILLLAKSFCFRDLRLVVFFVEKESIARGIATFYFPSPEFQFTRIYEPKNRSPYMAPPGKTSLIAEVPCARGDGLWSLEDEKLVRLIGSQLLQTGLLQEEKIIGSTVYRVENAYPVIEIDSSQKYRKIEEFLRRFENLKIFGRNGKFVYTSIHDSFLWSKKVIEGYLGEK